MMQRIELDCLLRKLHRDAVCGTLGIQQRNAGVGIPINRRWPASVGHRDCRQCYEEPARAPLRRALPNKWVERSERRAETRHPACAGKANPACGPGFASGLRCFNQPGGEDRVRKRRTGPKQTPADSKNATRDSFRALAARPLRPRWRRDPRGLQTAVECRLQSVLASGAQREEHVRLACQRLVDHYADAILFAGKGCQGVLVGVEHSSRIFGI